MKLYPFQKLALAFHLDHHYSLNCSTMGTGKTFMALATAKTAGLFPLVIGPAFLRGVWEAEAAKLEMVIAYLPYSTIHKMPKANLSRYRFWIADECHYLKNPTARRTHAFYERLESCLPDYFIGLTGTPIKNRVPDFWTLLAFCGLNPKKTSGKVLEGELRKYHAFSRHFCNVDTMVISGRKIQKYRGIKEDKIAEFKSYLQDKFIRFKLEDVVDDMPSLTRLDVPLDTVVGKGDSGLQEDFNNYMAGNKRDIAAKTKSAELKAGATVEYCKSLMEGGSGPLVIFTDHVESAKKLGAVSKTAKVITGQTSVERRVEAVKDFQDGKFDVLVATIGSLSVGVTLTAARHVVFNDLSWVPADNLQAEKRIHRIGQKDACFAHYIDATPTDTHIRRVLFDKLATMEKLVS